MSEKATEYSLEDLDIYYNDFVFGEYLRSVRRAKKISIRELAKKVNKTATYLSDIENGNNKPPDKELLEKIIKELHLEEYQKLKNNLFDLAAIERNDIPADIKEYLIQNKVLLDMIRITKDKPNSKEIWQELAKAL